MRAKSSKVVKQRMKWMTEICYWVVLFLVIHLHVVMEEVLPTEIQSACFTCLASFINLPLTVT